VFRQLCALLIVACCASAASAADYEKADGVYGRQLRNLNADDLKARVEAENKSIKDDKADPEPHIRKALALSALVLRDAQNKDKHWAAAIDSYREAMKLWKVIGQSKDDKRREDAEWRVARIHVYLAYCYVETAKYDEAETAFKEAAKNAKMEAMVKFGRDYLRMKKGK
jgi:tetratricopeptide (TPR) repeat protein